MKKLGLLTLCLMIIFTFSSCGGKQNDSSIKYDTIENIHKNTQPHQEIKLGNLTFLGSVRVPDINEVYTLKLARKDYVADMEVMVKFYSDTYDPSIIFKVPNQTPQDNIYETESFRFCPAEGGFVYWPLSNGTVDEKIYATLNCSNERVSITKPYRGEAMSEEELPMIDGNLSMKNAAADVEAFLNENLKKVEKSYDYKIRTVVTRKYDANAYVYVFFVERFYKGINLDATIGYTNGEYDVKNQKGNVSRVGLPLQVNVFSVGGYKTWNIISRSFNYCVTAEQKLENKFITFESAFNLLSNKISKQANITVNSAEFCYDISYPGYVSTEQMDENDTDPTARFFEQIKDYNSNPVWMFIVDRENEDASLQYSDMHATYMVNAVTGAIYIYNEENYF